MIRSCTVLICIVLSGFHGTSTAENIAGTSLRSFEAEYSINKTGITVGSLSRSLVITNENQYEFSSVAKTTGLAALFSSNATEETSRGNYSDSKIRTQRYDYIRRKGKKVKTEQLIFDQPGQTLKIDRRGVDSQRQLTIGSLDKISYQLQLMLDLLNDRRAVSYTVETATKTKTYKANETLSEEVSTPAGKYRAIRMEQSSGSNKSTTFWCSEDLGFLPVKVEILEDGDVTEIVLAKFQYLD